MKFALKPTVMRPFCAPLPEAICLILYRHRDGMNFSSSLLESDVPINRVTGGHEMELQATGGVVSNSRGVREAVRQTGCRN